MTTRNAPVPFDPKIFLSKIGRGKTLVRYRARQPIFAQGKSNKSQPEVRGRKRTMAVGLVLCLGLSGLFLAQLKSAGIFPRASVPVPQAGSTPALAKEYIYAGGKLVAVEEAGVPSGPGPTNLVATATAGTTVALTWTAPSGTISNYQVERSQSVNGPFTQLSPNPTATSFTDTTATAGKVRAHEASAPHSFCLSL